MSTVAPSYLDTQQRDVRPIDVWRNMEWQLLCNLRVSIPAVVQSFNAVQQTVRVQIAIRETILKNLIPTLTDIDTSNQDYPVSLPRAGGFTLTMPVQAGDECLLVFNDTCIDAWYQNGGTQNPPMDRRRHDLSDGVAVMGCWSQKRVLTGYSTSSAQLRSDDGVTVIDIKAGQITLSPDGGTTSIVVTPGSIVLNGNLTVNGNISNTGTLDGKTFLTHQHTGVTTGSGDSGPVL